MEWPARCAGRGLTLVAAVHVLVEKRAVLAGKRTQESWRAEALVFLAALVSVLGTIGAIHFGNVASKIKDDDLSRFEWQAKKDIAKAENDTAQAQNDAAAYHKAADALARAQGVESRTTTLEELTSRRVLSKSQQSLLTAQIAKLHIPKAFPMLWIETNDGDPESVAFKSQIAEAIHNAGIDAISRSSIPARVCRRA